jgi:hypothetical protein
MMLYFCIELYFGGEKGNFEMSSEDDQRNCQMNVEAWVMDWDESIPRKLDLRSNSELRRSFESIARSARYKYLRAMKYLDRLDREGIRMDLDGVEGMLNAKASEKKEEEAVDVRDLYKLLLKSDAEKEKIKK